MDSIVIISMDSKEIEKIYIQWKGVDEKMYFSGKELNMHIPDGNIYISLWEDALEFYEEDELKKIDIKDIDIRDIYFILVDYSNKDAAMTFMEKTVFSEHCYFDNDCGWILSLDQLRNNLREFVYMTLCDTLI